MGLILNIDTSTEKASISIARDDESVVLLTNNEQKDHSGWLHFAIRDAMERCGLSLNNLNAIGLTAGPGSYTGLRVGMATAKGLCYALQLPLITVNTLEGMAMAAINEEAELICPMIDARRLEVFVAMYDKALTPVSEPAAIILQADSFSEYLGVKRIVFFGSGHHKFKKIMHHPNAIFKDIVFDVSKIASLIHKKYNLSDFTELTWSQPEYMKEFHHTRASKS